MITLPSNELWSIESFNDYCFQNQPSTFLDALKGFLDCNEVYLQIDGIPVNTAFNQQGVEIKLRRLI